MLYSRRMFMQCYWWVAEKRKTASERRSFAVKLFHYSS